MHSLNDPSFFRTNTTGAAYELLLLVIRPHFNKSWTNLLLQLQLFSQIFWNFGPSFFYFILPGSVWIHELCFVLPSATVWIEVRSIAFMLFGKLLPVDKRINGGVLKMMSFWFEWLPSSLSEVYLHLSRSLFLFAVTVSKVKRIDFIIAQPKSFEHLILFFW